jgi:hypothetical protein
MGPNAVRAAMARRYLRRIACGNPQPTLRPPQAPIVGNHLEKINDDCGSLRYVSLAAKGTHYARGFDAQKVACRNGPHRDRRGLRDIAVTLNDAGHTTATGKPWHAMAVSRVLAA